MFLRWEKGDISWFDSRMKYATVMHSYDDQHQFKGQKVNKSIGYRHIFRFQLVHSLFERKGSIILEHDVAIIVKDDSFAQHQGMILLVK